MLAKYKDHIQVGMAGNLRDFILTNSDGVQIGRASCRSSLILRKKSAAGN
ncbi:hypothetical protein AKJ16_DCAP22374 [Drosera capensis]